MPTDASLITAVVWAAAGAVFLLIVAWLCLRAVDPGDDEQQVLARETLARLQELATRVAADVDEHSSRVQEINAELSAEEQISEDVVLAAVERLIAANEQMQQQLNSAEEKLQAQARQIESNAVEARTDALTQVANRRALDDELRRCVADFELHGQTSTMMLIDVDHFKKFNDSHGHQAGDEVLRGVARTLRQLTPDSALVARFGGEEFAVVFAGTSLTAAAPLAERARAAIAGSTFRFAGRELRVTASAGLAELLLGEDEKSLVRRSDEALYASKHAGRNCAHWNDGRDNQRLFLDIFAVNKPATGEPASALGDEWLYDADGNPEPMHRDPVAHVSSRPVFFDDLIRRLAHWKRSRTPLALLMVQIDGYGRITGEHGPTAGAVVLRVAAQLIKATTRDMDHVSRLGEDTFALLLPGMQLPDAAAIAERLRLAVERCRLPRRAGALFFTISIGAIEASEGDDMRKMLERSRIALQAAVSQGRNAICSHDLLGQVVEPAAAWVSRG